MDGGNVVDPGASRPSRGVFGGVAQATRHLGTQTDDRRRLPRRGEFTCLIHLLRLGHVALDYVN